MKKSKDLNEQKKLSLNKKTLMSLEKNISASGRNKVAQGGTGSDYICTNTCGTCDGDNTCDMTGCMTC